MKHRHLIPDLASEMPLGKYGLLPEDREIFLNIMEGIFPCQPRDGQDTGEFYSAEYQRRITSAWANYEYSLND